MIIGNEHEKKIMKAGLCTGCGICVGICPKDVFEIKENKAVCKDLDVCINCGLCEKCCPSYGYKLSDLNINHYGLFEAASKNETIRRKSTSGGAITQILHNALTGKYVDMVAAVIGSESIEKGLCRYILTDSIEDIQNASGTKYIQASLDEIIRKLKMIERKVAIVALPCQLYGLTQAMKYNEILKKNIMLKIGFFCGYTYENDCISGLSKIAGSNKNKIKRIVGWREGGLPGFCVLEEKDGNCLKIPFVEEHSIDVTFYANEKCLLCKDCFADYGDIVAGDIGRGWKDRKTLILTRTEKGSQWLKRLSSNMEIRALQATEWKDTPIRFMEIEKRSKVSQRIKARKKEGKNAPVWTGDYNEREMTAAQRISTIYLQKRQDQARENIDKYLANADRMLELGRHIYYQSGSNRWITYANLTQRAIQIICYTNWLGVIRNRMGTKNRRYSQAEKIINVAVIGLGAWGQQYITLLRKFRGTNIICIYDPNDAVCSKIANKYGLSIQTPEEMIFNKDIDTIFILTPNYLHYEQVSLALDHKKNVFVEKPLVNEHILAKELVRQASNQHLLLYVAHSMKTGKGFLMLKKLIENGKLGEIRQFSCVRSLRGLNPEVRASWRADAQLTPLLPMMQLGVHLLDASLYLFGELKCIGAVSNEICGVTESVVCILQGGGITGSLITSYDSCNTMEYVVYGTRARVVLNESELTLYHGKKRKVLLKKLNKENTLLGEVEDYYFWRMGMKKPLNTPERASDVVKLFEEIRQKIKQVEVGW